MSVNTGWGAMAQVIVPNKADGTQGDILCGHIMLTAQADGHTYAIIVNLFMGRGGVNATYNFLRRENAAD